MSPVDGNLVLVQRVAAKLAPLLEEVVLVGGCAVDLLITDPAAPPPRVTMDVDLTTEISSYAEFDALSAKLRSLGFAPGTRKGDPICRFRDPDGLIVDLVPSQPEILGFGSRWYSRAICSFREHELPSGPTIRCITAPLFLASKLEAFSDRGHGDHMASRDLEDVVAVVNGREDIVTELEESDDEVRSFVAGTIARLIANEGFRNALPGLVAESDQRRANLVLGRLEALARARS